MAPGLLVAAQFLAPVAVAATPGGVPTAMPLPGSSFVPFQAPSAGSAQRLDQATDTEMGPVQTFDPSARAQVIAREMPRQWSGTYQAFGGSAPVPVQLTFAAVTPVGAMVTLRGEMTIAGQKTPVQGNLNAQSDQLDLIPLAAKLGGGLHAGGRFQGLQGIALSGWSADRLTDMGGRLALEPIGARALGAPRGAGKAVPVRGLW
ncbi:MAG: hypothetical protein NTW02_13140 [Cyanobium sp. LacPavin_0920_WC12_MAG_62_9]|nr:hypothetical protein [Cyanobium sp. LacPavin_0920_WC12_MAG_62_9]